jgi:DNA-binding MarR family transcriptional regulator
MTGKRIGFELRALNNLIRRYFEFSAHKREIDRVTGNNGWIIGYLANHSESAIYQKDIEEHFTIARSTASKVLTRMEEKGLIERLAVEEDARLKQIVLTERAREISGIMTEDADGMEKNLMNGFSDAEIAQLVSYIDRMKENISIAMEHK